MDEQKFPTIAFFGFLEHGEINKIENWMASHSEMEFNDISFGGLRKAVVQKKESRGDPLSCDYKEKITFTGTAEYQDKPDHWTVCNFEAKIDYSLRNLSIRVDIPQFIIAMKSKTS